MAIDERWLNYPSIHGFSWRWQNVAVVSHCHVPKNFGQEILRQRHTTSTAEAYNLWFGLSTQHETSQTCSVCCGSKLCIKQIWLDMDGIAPQNSPKSISQLRWWCPAEIQSVWPSYVDQLTINQLMKHFGQISNWQLQSKVFWVTSMPGCHGSSCSLFVINYKSKHPVSHVINELIIYKSTKSSFNHPWSISLSVVPCYKSSKNL
jgi:hypothetical protein